MIDWDATGMIVTVTNTRTLKEVAGALHAHSEVEAGPEVLLEMVIGVGRDSLVLNGDHEVLRRQYGSNKNCLSGGKPNPERTNLDEIYDPNHRNRLLHLVRLRLC